MMAVAISTMMVGMMFTVSADDATDLSEMKVYAVDAAGNKTEVPMSFSATTYEYDLTVKSDVTSIEIEAEVKDSTSKWVVEKDGINTKMDTGTNKTVVAVTSSAGAVQRYTLNTKKLTEAEEATYKEPQAGDDASAAAKKSSKDTSVTVGKKKFKITSSFSNQQIPEGFKKSTEKYKGKKYTCIKGEVKEITAFYLYSKDKEGFYIYDKNQDTFYAMTNIKIKSRMYTIVQPEETDGIVEAYKTKNVTIIDQKVKAWVLDEEEGMYLVYAMNWAGETNLYSYDDNEKCFQRYLTSSDANRQSEAAAKAYNKLQKDYNKLVDKYNVLIKILCGLVILIIILIFVAINLGLSKKEKKVKRNDKYSADNNEITDTGKNTDGDELSKADKKAAKKEAKKAKKEEKKRQKYEQDEDDIDSGIAIDEKEEYQEGSEEHLAEAVKAIDDMEEEAPLEEIEEISEEEPAPVVDLEEEAHQSDIEETEKTASSENKEDAVGEDDLKATMKSLLPDDDDDDDDDDDFEFIDLD